ncbi:MAG: DUF4173 domain-containing protein [Gracilibacteraceae bacterium]|jgi:hypothetical protein|nr:DUF4173 domain-containing protein [Gracilibacteraceae bacterium]
MKGRILSSNGLLAVSGEGVSEGYKPKEPFAADGQDTTFAMFAFVLGFFFIRWVMFSWQGWGVTVFAIVYCFAVTMYFVKKGIIITRSGLFWLAAVILIGVSYSLYANNGLEPWRSLFLFCAAVYYVSNASGRLILDNTSNWLMLDGINAVFVIPFKNFGCQYKSLSSSKYIKRSFGKQFLSIALGLLLALLVAGMVLPLLLKADGGGFLRIANRLIEYYRWMQNRFENIIIEVILAIPTSAYIFGLAAGCAHNRGCSTFKREDIQYGAESVRILAAATVYTVLGLICLLYIVFIGSQLPYFFSAFAGQRPEGWQVYSEYARSGFFELCQIAAINLSLLTLANLFCRKLQGRNYALKILNCLLSLLTLLLIATAFSKMALYIGAYGLSIRRLLPCLFMVFLTVVFTGVIVLQKLRFSIVRFSIVAGTVMLCILCLLNPDGFVAAYNAERYLSGTLESFDVRILYQSGPAGIDPALKVYSRTSDKELKAELSAYIFDQREESTRKSGRTQDNLQNMLVRQKAAEFAEHKNQY